MGSQRSDTTGGSMVMQSFRVLGAGVILATALGTSCTVNVDLGNDRIDGSGVIETRSYDLDGFDEISIANALGAEIAVRPGSDFLVEVTADDNFFDHLEIEVSGSRLRAGTEDNVNLRSDDRVVVAIEMPALNSIDLSGATDVTVRAGDTALEEVEVSGASTLRVEDLDGSDIQLDASGASRVVVEGDGADTLRADVSGASTVELRDLPLESAEVDVSGASTLELGPVESVTGEASGASRIRVDDDTRIDIDTSGASSVDRR